MSPWSTRSSNARVLSSPSAFPSVWIPSLIPF